MFSVYSMYVLPFYAICEGGGDGLFRLLQNCKGCCVHKSYGHCSAIDIGAMIFIAAIQMEEIAQYFERRFFYEQIIDFYCPSKIICHTST